MKLNHKITLAALALASTAMAANEIIIVKTAEGSKRFVITESTKGSFSGTSLLIDGENVADISEISEIAFIDEAQLPFTVTTPDGTIAGSYEAVPSVLRQLPAESAGTTLFAFGTVEAAEASEIPAGEYGVKLSLSASALNNGGIEDLSTAPDSYTLKLYSYEEGQVVDSLTTVTSGAIKYQWVPNRRRLTLDIEATFDDGTVLKSEYAGTPVDVTTLAGIVPEPQYENGLIIVSPDGSSSTNYDIASVSASTRNATGSNPRTLVFDFESDSFYDSIRLEIIPESIVDKGDIDMATVTGNCYYFRCGSTQLYAVDAERQSPIDGIMRVTKTADNEYEIFVQVTNTFVSPWSTGTGGTGEKVTLYWNGPVE